ncbi:ImmA/IrrE family metallo-endopeptidase [Sphingomonas suaedae]|uniref:ImmA/IrrE family metallo-endopeptidase n=1 Tax=Sphingomonas suaedae TaxID=2599297 RepID=A0A518RBH2_9SPHN|nr:XRE family transcriptional regulator [Sphingomonas suaedae]QDX24822.1 ImmA/IrrE family metallo-endopeptidase [Sphingomonas suaedae]
MDNVVQFPAARSTAGGRLLIPARLRDARKVLRLSQEELGEKVGVTRQAISAFERGSRSPEPATFAALAAALDQPLGFFTSEDAPTFGDFSTRFYRKFGPETIRRQEACDTYSMWFTQVARHFDALVNYPAVNVPEYDPADFGEDGIDEIAEKVRADWGLGLGPISNVMALLESNGIIACKYEMSGESVEAFSFWNGTRPFIFMASEKDAGVRSRFDLAHELGHLVMHRHIEQSEIADKATLKEIERQADRFAGAFLLPKHSFPNEVFSPRLDAFVELKRRWKVSIGAMVYRCSDLGIFDENQILNLRKQISFRKWRTKEPLDDPRIIPVESPRLLAKAFGLVAENDRMKIDVLLQTLQISPSFIAAMCNLPLDVFKRDEPPPRQPTLK